MAAIASQRCLNHFDREAIARCVECGGFFCRECITEHDGRILCGSCLQKIVAPDAKRTGRFLGGFAGPVLAGSIGMLVAWYCFYTIGTNLLSMPSEFHPESLWSSQWQIGGGDE